MTGIGSAIYERLHGDADIVAAVREIVPIYRDETPPAIVFGAELDHSDTAMEGERADYYECTVSCVGRTLKEANALAELVQSAMEFDQWSTADWDILGCFYRDRREESLELAGKNRRICVVELVYDLIATQAA